jgi:hypothetical protein
MPKYLSLKEKFRGEIDILLVTSNSKEEIKALFERFKGNEIAKTWIDAVSKLPVVFGDSFFCKLFPAKALPANVWINKNLIYFGMAYPTSASEKNISAWIEGKAVRIDEIINRNISLADPLGITLASQNYQTNLLSCSILTSRVEFGLGASPWVTNLIDSSTQKQTGISCVNCSISELYKIAYSDSREIGPLVPDHRVIWHTKKNVGSKKPALYPPEPQISTYFAWAQANTFCYLFKSEHSHTTNLKPLMRADLDRVFGMKSSIQKINVPCYVLKIESNYKTGPFDFRQKVPSKEKYLFTDDSLVINGLQFEQVYISIQRIGDVQRWSIPIINEVPYAGNVNISLNFETSVSHISIRQLNKHLHKYGLTLSKEFRRIPMLVVEDM